MSYSEIEAELTRMGAPLYQGNGRRFSAVGRLRALNREVIGYLTQVKIWKLEEEVCYLKSIIKELRSGANKVITKQQAEWFSARIRTSKTGRPLISTQLVEKYRRLVDTNKASNHIVRALIVNDCHTWGVL